MEDIKYMIVFFGTVAIVLFLIGLASHFVSRRVYRNLVKSGSSSAMTIRIVVFIASYLVIAATLVLLIIKNVNFGR